MKLKISKTVYPPKQPPIWEWMKELKVSTRMEVKSHTNNADNMNRCYDWKKISA